MNRALGRFYEDHRRALVVLAALLAGNVAFWLLAAGPAKLRASALRGDLESAEADVRKALREYGQGLLESRLYADVDRRMAELCRETLQERGRRYATVDAKIKELAARFDLEPHSIAYNYLPLAAERLEKLTVSFHLKGSYDRLRRFVREVEQARDEEERDLFFAIERIGLSDSTEEGSELNLQIQVTTYFHNPELEKLEPRAPRRRG